MFMYAVSRYRALAAQFAGYDAMFQMLAAGEAF